MAFGDYNGPDKPNKGHEGGACNRQRCQAEPAIWYNHGSYRWYCSGCRTAIEFDSINSRTWPVDFKRLYPAGTAFHPMFETREQIDARDDLESLNGEK